MKAIGMTSVLAVITSLTVALLGAAPAVASSGTLLCENAEDPCLPQNRDLAPTLLQGETEENSPAIFETTSGTISCQASGLALETVEEGEPMTAKVTGLFFEGCEREGEECAVAPSSLPYPAQIEAVEAGNGTLTVGETGGKAARITVNCGGEIECTYSGAPTLDFIGGNPAEVRAEEETFESTEFPCPELARFTANYSTTGPNGGTAPTHGDVTICSKKEENCESSSTYEEKTEGEGVTSSAVFEPPEKKFTVECSKSTLRFETLETKEHLQLNLLFTAPTFGSCGEGCTAAAGVGSGTGHLKATGGGDGRVTIDFLKVEFNCPLKCVYASTSGVILKLNGGEKAVLVAKEVTLTLSEGLLCQPSVEWSASYTMETPNPLYVSG